MRTTNVLIEHLPAYPDDGLADSNLEKDETDDLEEFPVLLQSCDVRDLIDAARMRGLSATGLARRLVRAFLGRTRDVLSVGNVPLSEGRS